MHHAGEETLIMGGFDVLVHGVYVNDVMQVVLYPCPVAGRKRMDCSYLHFRALLMVRSSYPLSAFHREENIFPAGILNHAEIPLLQHFILQPALVYFSPDAVENI